MAFIPEQPKTPAAIGDIAVVLTDYLNNEPDSEGNPRPDTVGYEVQVLQADGSMFRHATGDLVLHLTPQQISALQSFMASMRTLAQGLLP